MSTRQERLKQRLFKTKAKKKKGIHDGLGERPPSQALSEFSQLSEDGRHVEADLDVDNIDGRELEEDELDHFVDAKAPASMQMEIVNGVYQVKAGQAAGEGQMVKGKAPRELRRILDPGTKRSIERKLLEASYKGDSEALIENLQFRINPNCRNEAGTPLHNALAFGHLNIVEILIAKGAYLGSKDVRGCSPLHVAAERAPVQGVELLLNMGVDLEDRDVLGWTALHYAVADGRTQVIALLLNAGAEFGATNFYGATCIHIAAQTNQSDSLATLMPREGFNVHLNDRDKFGRTAAHIAAMNGCKEVLDILCNAGIMLDIQDFEGLTALHYTAQLQQKECMQILLECSAKIQLKDLRGRLPTNMTTDQSILQQLYVYLVQERLRTKQNDTEGDLEQLESEDGPSIPSTAELLKNPAVTSTEPTKAELRSQLTHAMRDLDTAKTDHERYVVQQHQKIAHLQAKHREEKDMRVGLEHALSAEIQARSRLEAELNTMKQHLLTLGLLDKAQQAGEDKIVR